MEYRLTPIRDPDGSVTGAAVFGRDVSERIQSEETRAMLEEQLRHLQKMEAIGTLAGGIAHDFNNLLTPILGTVDILAATADEDTRADLEVIRNSAQRGAELAQQLLGFARRGKLRKKAIDAHGVVRNVVRILQRSIDKRIGIDLRLDAQPSSIMGDPGQLEQVVMNLAVNARDAMPEGGTLRFETNNVNVDENHTLHAALPAGDYICLTVSDTGRGMTDAVRTRAFEPFFTTKPAGEGAGMGLSMVYGIARNHGGTVDITSEPEFGTSVDVLLPLVVAETTADEADGDGAPETGTGTVLVVDDEAAVRHVVHRMLNSLGYEVVQAAGGREALEQYEQNAQRYDLVVLDLSMPGMDGATCFRRLKQLDPGIKVVIASGHARDGAAQALLDEGANGFIQKPFLRSQLSRVVANVLSEDASHLTPEMQAENATSAPGAAHPHEEDLRRVLGELNDTLDEVAHDEAIGLSDRKTLRELSERLRRVSQGDISERQGRHELANLLLGSRLFFDAIGSTPEVDARTLRNLRRLDETAGRLITLIQDRQPSGTQGGS
jgi:signal transduction histidine kinase/DNA-binding NarL/FixJ family response regulator